MVNEIIKNHCSAGKALSIWRSATGCTDYDSNFGREKRFSLLKIRPAGSWGPPSVLYIRYGATVPWVKRPGGGVDHPLASSAEVKERVEL